MPNERRHHRRYPISAPICVGSMKGTTINLSLTGVLFRSSEPFPPGRTIDFSVVLQTETGPLHVQCAGRVTRCAAERGGWTVAATIDDFGIVTENAANAALALAGDRVQ